jgi:3-phenylpropionate/trans-cinnamate dioxygenase ferredoxin reductase subunit
MERASRDIVLVGGGLAGATAAESLRQHGYDGTITIVGEEREPPYERPPLSKDLLLGEGIVEDVYVHPRNFYVENGIDLLIDDAATRCHPRRSPRRTPRTGAGT